MDDIIGIAPFQFVHVLDMNTNITRLEVGPQTLVLQSNERLVAGPLPMIVIPPAHYCVVLDPVTKFVPGKGYQQKLGQSEIRFHKEPFPLYPGESLQNAADFGKKSNYLSAILKLPVVRANHAIQLEAVLDHDDENGVSRKAGDRWQLDGPLMYMPTPYSRIVKIVDPVIIKTGEALVLRAVQDCEDINGEKRVTGEEWLIKEEGAYLAGVNEEVVRVEKKQTLTPETGLILKANQTLVDSEGKDRLAGEMWLVTGEMMTEYLPEIGVEVVSQVKITVLNSHQFCVIINPVDPKTLKPQFGQRQLRKGVCTFFLHPGEEIQNGIQQAFVLSENEALLLRAIDNHTEVVSSVKGPSKIQRKCGERWMILGPTCYIPPIEVEVLNKRSQIPLSKNEGIYVQDIQKGTVRLVMGPQSYMLAAYEELWEKELSDITEILLRQGGGHGTGDIRKMAYFEQSIDPQILKGRDKTRMVTYRCPGNTAVQVNNYLEKTSRVVFGPDLVILDPHEDFTILSLSAGKPKKEGAMKSLCLMLGPDFITDILEVETSDHARLSVQVAFNNHFEYTKGNPRSEAAIFSVPDFIGYACRQLGSRIRAAVARTTFDEFHRHSSQVILNAVFQKDGVLQKEMRFTNNNLVITTVDVQSIEPVDMKMRDSLSKSVQLAIEISTKSIEAAAAHEAGRNEQISRGQLERQKLHNEKEAEIERCKLLELKSITAAVESTGQATAEAQAQAERILIECESEIEAAKLRAQAAEIEHQAKLEAQYLLRRSEVDYQRNLNSLEIAKTKKMADIEVKRFSDMVKALGVKTIEAMAIAGPEAQMKLLASLGIESTLITDGKSPINLFNTANGLVGKVQ
ncbi:hypothetical protein ACJMK2_005775 [Sinanodonta woodiana]|uniref:Major vault protein n=1 Tax=Sinanodonta woodiana TaxID=1069815 RepID=A0ABD3VR59_SINWO